MTTWTKLPPLEGGFSGCLNCGYQHDKLKLNMRICVGFGEASVRKDGEFVWEEDGRMEYADCWTVQKAENRARKDPDHDWRITLDAPLSGRTYQRHGKNLWLLVEKNRGFA
jgi:hypothetical protein